MQLSEIQPTIKPIRNTQRGGLSLTFDTDHLISTPVASPAWQVAGWELRFLQLPANERVETASVAQPVYLKVITGRLAHPQQTAYAAPFEVRSTRLNGEYFQSGPDGALLAVFIELERDQRLLSRMEQIQFAGEGAEALAFESFHQKFSEVTSFFEGADAYMAPGIHLLDQRENEIANVIFWTAGKGVSLSTHNHGHPPSPLAPAFAEVHWVFSNGTGNGGMYLCDEADTEPSKRFPMHKGEEHGPFFHLDQAGKRPRLKDNGAVDYPWHGWEGGTDSKPGQAYDFVCAFEITPEYAQIDPE